MRSSLLFASALLALLLVSPAAAAVDSLQRNSTSSSDAPSQLSSVAATGAKAAVAPQRLTAAPVVSSRSGGANLRAYPWAAAFRWVPNGTQLIMICWRDSVWMNGNYWTNRWFYVTALVGGRYYNPSGYIHASLVANQATVPWCPRWYEPSGG